MTGPSESRTGPLTPSMGWLQAGIRFALELVMLGALGYWGWSLSDNTLIQVGAAIGIPAIAAALWGIFRAPGDTSAGKPAIVPVPGPIRLLLEFALFGLAAYGLWTAVSRAAAETLLTITVLHYVMTWQRVRWLLTGRGEP